MWCEFSGELGAVCGVSSLWRVGGSVWCEFSLESWGQCVV